MMAARTRPRGLSRRHPAWWIATWCGVGLAPVAPGSAASLVALPIAWAIAGLAGWLGLLLASLLVFAVGVWAAALYQAAGDRADPREVVVDEVAGQWLVLVPAAAMPMPALWHYGLAFLLFRAADIAKPWPVGWIDRRVGGGLGIMLDDLAAGLYGALALGLALYLAERS
jgi:phosphatidylglycerophosphatase A